MSFIANGIIPPEPADKTITNYAFYPEISLNAFRTVMRVDSVTSEDRALHALQAAVIEVNNRLSVFMTRHIEKGIASIDQVPLLPGDIEHQHKTLYLRAVWSLAKANLIERYRDFDSTKMGHEKADSLEPSIDDYRRDAAWAINDLTGIARSTVELI